MRGLCLSQILEIHVSCCLYRLRRRRISHGAVGLRIKEEVMPKSKKPERVMETMDDIESVTSLQLDNDDDKGSLDKDEQISRLKEENDMLTKLLMKSQRDGESKAKNPFELFLSKRCDLPKLRAPNEVHKLDFISWKESLYDCANQHGAQENATPRSLRIFVKNCMTAEWQPLWRNGGLHGISEAETLEEMLMIIEEYVDTRKLPLIYRRELFERKQKEGENVTDFSNALKDLFIASGFENTSQDELLSMIFLFGLRDESTELKLLEQGLRKPTFEQIVNLSLKYESARNAMASEKNINLMKNTSSSFGKGQSFFKPMECYFCGKPGHMAKYCRRRQGQVKAIHFCNDHNGDTGNGRENSMAFRKNNDGHITGIVSAVSLNKRPYAEVTVKIVDNNGTEKEKNIVALVDTGADLTAVNQKTMEILKSCINFKLVPCNQGDIKQADGSLLEDHGQFDAVIDCGKREVQATIKYIPKLSSNILGGEIAQKLKLVTFSHEVYSLSVGTNPIMNEKIEIKNTELYRQRFLQTFHDVFNETELQPMKGPKMKIEISEDAIPAKRYKAYTIPYNFERKVKAELDSIESKGIIEKVPVGEPIVWCHPMIVVPKKGSDEPRLTVDLRQLNKYVKRPLYPNKVPREEVAKVPKNMCYFTTLDSKKGYWQIELDEASKKLTTFITPYGCYRYTRNVMGLISAGDEHNRRGDEALKGIQNIVKVVEDILIFDNDLETHLSRVEEVLKRCREHGITLNKNKMKLAQSEVEFCGYRINKDGYTVSKHLVEALEKFPTPTKQTHVRSFLGLAQQFEAFSPKISELSSPLRALIGKNSAFRWDSLHDEAFTAMKKALCNTRYLAQFDPKADLRLETDASQTEGLGYALWQKSGGDNIWKLLQCGSRSLSGPEKRYAVTEIELLAVVWATKKCRLYLHGKDFELIVDHQALVPILNKKYLDEIQNVRLQRMKERLGQYRFSAIWRKGSLHTVADVLSRYPVTEPEKEDNELNEELDFTVSAIEEVHKENFQDAGIKDILLHKIQTATKGDPDMINLKEMIQKGFPSQKSLLPERLRDFWRIREDLIAHDNLIIWGHRIIIPKELRADMIKAIHAGHFGTAKCLKRAHKTFYWPGLANDIKNHIRDCRVCIERSPSQPNEPMIFSESNEPFEMLHADIFQFAAKEFLVFVDNFSGWWSIASAQRMTSETIIKHFQRWFSAYGIPKRLITDGGSVFTSSVFENWCKDWNIHHSVSSPYNPQSNGKAENAVKIAKNLLAKTSPNGDMDNENFQRGILEQRNTPGVKGKSPAELVYGRFTRSFVPELGVRFKVTEQGDKQERKGQKGRVLPSFEVGQKVWIQNFRTKRWDQHGTILEQKNDRRSYIIVDSHGTRIWRNRRFLKPKYGTVEYSNSNLDTRRPSSIAERRERKKNNRNDGQWVPQRRSSRQIILPARYRD